MAVRREAIERLDEVRACVRVRDKLRVCRQAAETAYVSIRSADVSIRPHTFAYVWVRDKLRVCRQAEETAYVSIRSADVSIRQLHTLACVRRQHTPAYVSIRWHTPAYVTSSDSAARLKRTEKMSADVCCSTLTYADVC